MKFTDPGLVEQTIWTMRLADMPRGTNRALIDRLANGAPPWTKAEQEMAAIKTNVNWLEFPKLAADARRSYYNAFMKPGVYFNVTVEGGKGSASKRREWGQKITREMNKVMKAAPKYFEFLRSQFALTVLHGIGPGFWSDCESWCPTCIGIEDLLIPSNTLLTMENLSHFAVYRQYTPMELRLKTMGKYVDPAWNMPVVKSALEWADQQTQAQLSYNDIYAPQKVEERWKQDLGFYGTDAVPTINCWDFYFWSDDKKKEGWRRRMVLDTPVSGEIESGAKQPKIPDKNMIGKEHGQWLYCPSDERTYADSLSEILHFQFGDASAVAPFRYHSVRSLGWLLYAVCHCQNRLRCKVNDALFESLLQYFRTSNPDDRERITKIDLHNLGVVPEGVEFVKPQDRWQINQQFVQMGLMQNRAMMDESAAQYREGRDLNDKTEKTATQIMAEVNAANALVGSMLNQSYQYQKFQGIEIARRFSLPNSSDADVRKFRLAVLKAGVPEEALDSSLWEINPERVMGAGNKTLEIAIADKLMAVRPLHDPESQRKILHIYDAVNSDIPDLADELVPMGNQQVTNSTHDAQLMVGTLMQGVPVQPKEGQNPIEMIETLMVSLGMLFKKATMKGPKVTADEVLGMVNISNTVQQYIGILAGDKNEKERVAKYSKDLKGITMAIQQMGQAVLQQQQQQGGNGGGVDPETQVKLQSELIKAQAKATNMREAHQQRTQQRDTQFKMKMQQDVQRHQVDLAKKAKEIQLDTMAKDVVTAAEIRRGKMKDLQE